MPSEGVTGLLLTDMLFRVRFVRFGEGSGTAAAPGTPALRAHFPALFTSPLLDWGVPALLSGLATLEDLGSLSPNPDLPL